MAIACARCGAQNPDGNRFCQSCGAPLAAVPQQPATPVGGAPAAPWQAVPYPGQAVQAPPPPPPGPQPAYASPYYAPAAGGAQPPVHRTPWVMIVAVVVGLVVIMAGCGTVLAFSGFGKKTQTGSGFNALTSPSPAGTPTPLPSPTGTPGSSGSETNSSETVIIPKGWTVISKDDQSITLQSPSGDGSITIGSGPQSPPQNAQQDKSQLDAYFKQKFPDTKDCAGTKTSTGAMDGAKGIFWQLCFTVTSGSQSIAIGAPLFVGANSNGSVYYLVLLETEASNMDAFIAEATPIMKGGIHWKLS
jgi:hypothetical protein